MDSSEHKRAGLLLVRFLHALCRWHKAPRNAPCGPLDTLGRKRGRPPDLTSRTEQLGIAFVSNGSKRLGHRIMNCKENRTLYIVALHLHGLACWPRGKLHQRVPSLSPNLATPAMREMRWVAIVAQGSK
eukprot:1852485-Amphidinium_carterae.2